MGSIVTVSNYKGGGGKTALTTAVAVHLASRGYSVAVIDADPNQTFALWHKANYEGPAIDCRTETDDIEVVDLANKLADETDLVLIDTAGFKNLTAQSAMSAADLVLIPCMADSGTVRETIRTARKVESLNKAAAREIKLRVVKVRWDKKGQAERAALADLEDAKLPIMSQHLSNLVEWKKLTFSGVVPTVGTVADEVSELVQELIQMSIIEAKPAIGQAA